MGQRQETRDEKGARDRRQETGDKETGDWWQVKSLETGDVIK